MLPAPSAFAPYPTPLFRPAGNDALRRVERRGELAQRVRLDGGHLAAAHHGGAERLVLVESWGGAVARVQW